MVEGWSEHCGSVNEDEMTACLVCNYCFVCQVEYLLDLDDRRRPEDAQTRRQRLWHTHSTQRTVHTHQVALVRHIAPHASALGSPTQEAGGFRHGSGRWCPNARGGIGSSGCIVSVDNDRGA